MVTARVALASSLNVPAVKTLNLIGIDSFVETMQPLDFRGIRDAEYYGLSIALGSADITLWDLVDAYRALANGGVWSPLRLTADRRRNRGARSFHRNPHFCIRHTFRPRKPQPDLLAGKPSVHPLLDGGKDRHQQGHARQLVRRLFGPVHSRQSGQATFRGNRCGTSAESLERPRSGSKS